MKIENYGMAKVHNPKSVEVYKFISDLDFKNGDFFWFKSGGDGDNGECLMDLLDVYFKHNKEYSPDLCCLVPCNVNSLFTRHDKDRGDLPIGVCYFKRQNAYRAQCNNPFQNNKRVGLGYYSNPIDAFKAYKKYKENIIKKVAKDEYIKGNITKECFKAMINYQVEITD